MRLEIVAVWSRKQGKLVSFEQVPDFETGLDKVDRLREKYFSKVPETREKSELEKFAEDISWSEDPNYDVIQYSIDVPNLETAKQEFIAERTKGW